MQRLLDGDKREIERLGEQVETVIKNLEKIRLNTLLIAIIFFMFGFFLSEYYYTCKIKNMVYWNQKKIDNITSKIDLIYKKIGD
jgi:hypothetical protein